MANSTLGEKLLELRTNRKLTQQQVSEALHIGRVTYTYYEGNKRTPDLGLLLSICKFYGIEIEELINEDTIPVSIPDAEIGERVITMRSAMIAPDFSKSLISDVLDGVMSDKGVRPPFNKVEKELITNFRQLNPEEKEEVCHLIKYKLRKQKKK